MLRLNILENKINVFRRTWAAEKWKSEKEMWTKGGPKLICGAILGYFSAKENTGLWIVAMIYQFAPI